MTVPTHIEALTFDVFGTVVDWHSSIVAEGQALSARTGLSVDWDDFAETWRAGYQPAMQQVRSGMVPWTTLDVLHRHILDDLVPRFGLTQLNEDELANFNRVWHRLEPWPDARVGLERLRRHFVVAALSNGNMALLTRMAKAANLGWDVILSAELAHHYKPDIEVYQTAITLLDLHPNQIMMVAAHVDDLTRGPHRRHAHCLCTSPVGAWPRAHNRSAFRQRI